MVGSKKLLALAVAAAFSAQAVAQAVSPEQALGNNADAIRSYNQVQAGLERAQRAPLEAVWLRAEVLEEMWQRNPALSQALQGCDKAGTPKQGCAVSGRTFWRFTLAPTLNAFAPGLSAQAYRASPPETESLPPAGGVYLVASASAIGQKGSSVLLAAGATAQLIDTAYPSILIEVKAPDDQPLLLGSLAASDIGKALALISRPKTQVASIAPVQRVMAPAKPDFSGDFGAPAAALEAPVALAKRDAPRTLELDAATVAALDLAPRIDLKGDFTTLVAAIELPTALVKREAPRALEMDAGIVAALDVAPKREELDTKAIAALDIAPKVEIAPKPIVIAAVAPKPINVVVDVAPAPSTNADVARMRAEIEAEIARENARLAQNLQGRTTRRTGFGT